KVMTSHGIAYAVVGKHYAHKLEGNLTTFLVSKELSLTESVARKQAPILADCILATLNKFLSDDSPELNLSHVVINRNIPGFADMNAAPVLKAAKLLWSRMKDPEYHGVPMTHDGYL